MHDILQFCALITLIFSLQVSLSICNVCVWVLGFMSVCQAECIMYLYVQGVPEKTLR